MGCHEYDSPSLFKQPQLPAISKTAVILSANLNY